MSTVDRQKRWLEEGRVTPSLTSHPFTATWTASALWSPSLLIFIHNFYGHSSGDGGDQASSPEQEAQRQDNYLKSLKKYDLCPRRPEGLWGSGIRGECHVWLFISKGLHRARNKRWDLESQTPRRHQNGGKLGKTRVTAR